MLGDLDPDRRQVEHLPGLGTDHLPTGQPGTAARALLGKVDLPAVRVRHLTKVPALRPRLLPLLASLAAPFGPGQLLLLPFRVRVSRRRLRAIPRRLPEL